MSRWLGSSGFRRRRLIFASPLCFSRSLSAWDLFVLLERRGGGGGGTRPAAAAFRSLARRWVGTQDTRPPLSHSLFLHDEFFMSTLLCLSGSSRQGGCGGGAPPPHRRSCSPRSLPLRCPPSSPSTLTPAPSRQSQHRPASLSRASTRSSRLSRFKAPPPLPPPPPP